MIAGICIGARGIQRLHSLTICSLYIVMGIIQILIMNKISLRYMNNCYFSCNTLQRSSGKIYNLFRTCKYSMSITEFFAPASSLIGYLLGSLTPISTTTTHNLVGMLGVVGMGMNWFLLWFHITRYLLIRWCADKSRTLEVGT
jgi:hypothetical protein